MKTKIEVLGYVIEVEETEGVVTVKAEFDGETVEEFTLESQEGGEEGGEDVKGFDSFDGEEEEDFDGEETEEEEEFDEEEEEESKLESFQTFVSKK